MGGRSGTLDQFHGRTIALTTAQERDDSVNSMEPLLDEAGATEIDSVVSVRRDPGRVAFRSVRAVGFRNQTVTTILPICWFDSR